MKYNKSIVIETNKDLLHIKSPTNINDDYKFWQHKNSTM